MPHIEKRPVLPLNPALTLGISDHFIADLAYAPLKQPEVAASKTERKKFRAPWTVLREWRRKKRLARKFLQGFTPITQFSPEDVFIVGYPKSGNTWFQDLVTSVVYGVNPIYAPPSLAHALVPDVHGKPFYQRVSQRMFFKSHHLPRPDYRKVVYLVRDGRDAMVSFYHFNRATNGQADLLEMVQTGKDVLQGKWHDHVNAWLENPHQAEMLVIKYEDLKRDACKEMQRFCAFTGIERDVTFLKQVTEQTAFDKMQKREKQCGSGHPEWPADKLFRRRGTVGSYKDEMPAEVLQAFMQQAKDALVKCGYI